MKVDPEALEMWILQNTCNIIVLKPKNCLSEFSEEIEFSLINNWNICPIVEHLKIY